MATPSLWSASKSNILVFDIVLVFEFSSKISYSNAKKKFGKYFSEESGNTEFLKKILNKVLRFKEYPAGAKFIR